MDKKNQDIWVGMAHKNNDPALIEAAGKEFVELPIIEALGDEKIAEVETNRRDFLKYLGFGLGAATVAASCDVPVKRAIPYVTKPDEIVPGVATYYASSFVKGGDYCSVLVKTREGRPIKIEGNVLSPLTNGGTSARAQASVLELYDVNRNKMSGTVGENGAITPISWADLDKAVMGKLNGGSKIRIVTNTVLSPTTKQVFADFQAKYPNTKVVTYDPISSSAILEANEQSFGDRILPDYHFDKADTIVSFGADFLGTWISPIEYATAYAKGRKVNAKNPKMSRHIQIESGMSLTGSNADNRVLIKPSEMGAAIATFYSAMGGGVSAPKLNAKATKAIRSLANQLSGSRGNSIVVSSSNNVMEQIMVNKINEMLGNLGKTVTFTHGSLQRQGIDREIQNLITEMQGGSVDAVLVLDANPAFDLPNSDKFITAFAKVPLKVSLSYDVNETMALCDYIAPTHHYLESWGDAEPKRGYYSIIQPTITPLFPTRQAEASLLTWAGSAKYKADAEQPYYDYLRNNWNTKMSGAESSFATFRSFWDETLHDGVAKVGAPAREYTSCAASMNGGQITQPSNSAIEIDFMESVNMGAGQYANNPWLMEMPDPVTRTSWGNYLGVPVKFDGAHTFEGYKGIGSNMVKGYADVVNLTQTGAEEATPITAFPQFGQPEGTVATSLGYGRKICGDAGRNVGTNMFPYLSIDQNGNTQYYATNVEVSDIIDINYDFPCVQYHHTLGVTAQNEAGETINADEAALVDFTYGVVDQGFQGSLTDRSVIYTTNIKDLSENIEMIEKKREEAQHLNSQTLYPGHEYLYENGHHWGMYVDLNACTGCSACTVACMAENNVPVVGAKEVSRHHEMTWLRIDRYFYGDAENPNTAYQPMMCQHCDNAPCENVCPVAATNHSSEGLNQMAYNRCVGTRYCANNCPYKVRRFNWMDYTTADIFPANQLDLNEESVPYGADNLTRMVLNPDVTVRSRGVIEKCSFCVQRIQEGKLTAKREMRKLRDQDVKTACQTACPTGAIVFGDMNNKKGELNKALDNNPLAYIALEEINVQSSVRYTAVVNNRDESLDA